MSVTVGVPRVIRHLAVLAVFCGVLVAAVEAAKAQALPDRTHLFLQNYCVDCHNAELAESDFRVDPLNGDFTERSVAAAWLEVRNRINLGEMPPPEAPQPSGAEVAEVSRWVAAGLREAERAARSADGRVLMRRMNREEYAHTLADLLHLRFPPGESPLDYLPPDGTAEGFNKVSSALLIDPSLMLQYYDVARQIADRAIVDGPPEYPTETMRLEYEELPESHAIGYMITRRGLNPAPGGLELIEGDTRSWGMLEYPGQPTNHVAPTSGFYRFTVKAGAKPGADGKYPRIRLRHDHPDQSQQIVMEQEITAAWDDPQEYTVIVPRDTLGKEVHVEILNETKLYMSQRPGEHFFRRIRDLGAKDRFADTIRLTGRKVAEGWGGDRSTPDPEKLDLTRFPRVFLDYLEVEGPLYEQWPPRSHADLLFRGELGDGEQPLVYAREILTRFLRRAWRRPVRSEELEPIVGVVERELEHGASFHEALRVGLTAALTSPKFLFLAEPVSGAQPRRPLNDFELASRLSYFLWNSMPDDELFAIAERGDLRDKQVLTTQVNRMLADTKAARMRASFARQWLRTEEILAFAPDRAVYRAYDDELGEAAEQEPLEFLRYLIEQNLSLLNLLDSEFVVVNERLAEHYDLPGVSGKAFQRVDLPADSPRGGLLGMAGVHLAGADGLRTKPVSRAVYVREVLFNNPPDPPPPNAGEIEPNIEGERLTVRQRLLQHQQIESCAACHRNLDPYGLALENFNVIGHWRDQQDGEDFRGGNRPEIDASGQLPGGQAFADYFEFKQILRGQADRFRRGLAEKLWVYALGRPVEPSDDAALQRITRKMAAADDRWDALILALVHSQEFQSK